jgi:cell division protein FtsW
MSQTRFALSQARHLLWWVIALSGVGLVYLTNVSLAESLERFGTPWYYLWQQLRWIALGSIAFFIVSRFSLKQLRTLAPLVFWGVVALLVAVLLPGLGSSSLGAQRWVELGPIRIQPSEMTKLAVVLFFAQWLERHQRFAPFLALTGMLFLLILVQPNLSTASIVVLLATSLYYFAGGAVKQLAIFGGVGAVLIALLIVAAPYRRERLLTFLNPASDPLGSSYHIRQITLALGRGGWLGQGLGMSTQKYEYIPEASTDSVFAIYAEEMGFIGSTALVGVMGLFVIGLLGAAREHPDRFGSLILAGVGMWIGLHVVLNVAAMVALIPLTGIPFPFFSRGGSLYLSLMAGLGLAWRALKEGEGGSGVRHHPRSPNRPRVARRATSR